MSFAAGYQADLAYIHDAGFSGFSLGAAPAVVSRLRRSGAAPGRLVVDVGCGSGRLAAALNRAGYRVLGFDQSPHMVRLAKRNAPHSKFAVQPLLDIALPECAAITSVGECLNYTFDKRNTRAALERFFARVIGALTPGGVFIFDFATPARLPANPPRQNWMEGDDWAVLVNTTGASRTLVRRIVCFRRIGRNWRRAEETHRLRLYTPEEIRASLVRCGFSVEISDSYGRCRLPDGIVAVYAAK